MRRRKSIEVKIIQSFLKHFIAPDTDDLTGDKRIFRKRHVPTFPDIIPLSAFDTIGQTTEQTVCGTPQAPAIGIIATGKGIKLTLISRLSVA